MAARNRSIRRFGVAYKIRLLFLFTLLILASWYAKQKYNNPFTPRPFIDITGSREYISIRCYQKLPKTEKDILLFLQPKAVTNFSNYVSQNSVGTENLVTLDVSENIFTCFLSPPKNWTVLNTRQKIDTLLQLPETWPEPIYSNSISGQEMLTLQRIYPFNDTIPGTYLTYDDVRILFLSDISVASDSGSESLVKEKFDLAILNTTDIESILSIRKILRPKYLIIATEIKNKAIDSLSNILNPHGTDFNFTVFKDSKNRVQVENK